MCLIRAKDKANICQKDYNVEDDKNLILLDW